MVTSVKLGSVDAAPNQQEILRQAARLLQEAVNHPNLKAEIDKADFSGGTYMRDFVLVDGKKKLRTIEADKTRILEIIQKGEEREKPKDDVINMDIMVKPHRKGVVGSARLGQQPIMPSTAFVEKCRKANDGASLARHLIHEWLHVAGFFHLSSGPKQDDVPYEVGEIVRKLIKNLSGPGLAEDLRPYAKEDSLIAHELDEAEDEMIELDEGWEVVTAVPA